MMQSSDLDKKVLPLSPNSVNTQNRVSEPTIPNYLSAVSKSTASDVNHAETSPKEVNSSSGIPSEPELSLVPSNGKVKTAEENLNLETNLDTQFNGNGDGGDSVIDNIPSQGLSPVLKNPNFLALWGGQIFSQLADKVYLVMMIALIHSQFKTGNQSISGWVSALMISFTIPAVLFGSIAGVYVDRWLKKTVLIATNIWRGLLVFCLPLLLWLTHSWQPVGVLPVGFLIILGITFLVSTLTQFFSPAEQAAIPLVVEEQHLLSANSLYTTTMMASVIVGFAVGEPVLVLADTIWGKFGGGSGLGKEILVGGSYAIAGLILFLLSTKEKPHPPETEFPHVFSDLTGRTALPKSQSYNPECFLTTDYPLFHFCRLNRSCSSHGGNYSQFKSLSIRLFTSIWWDGTGNWGDNSWSIWSTLLL